MSAGSSLTADFTVPLFGALLCVTPAITRPTVQPTAMAAVRP